MEVASPPAHQTLSAISTAELPSSVSPFAHNLIRVLSLTRGHCAYQPTRGLLTLAFELTAAEVAQVERWKARDTTADDLTASMYVCVLLIGQGLPKHLLKTVQYPCEPDGSVDLGAHGLHPGVNTLQIYQHRDYSDRAFAIVLHHSTAAHLAELQRLRNQDRSWREMLGRLGTFNIPVPTVMIPTLPKVNAMCDSPIV
ncbi:hypothetical protein OH76DRAFT_1476882 [Lentinus brumalis]|uniref:Uncharacterized protein n=1 Tax=Lentinus brumalis TaxID=2498619 RepID=A0A371DYA3_9APHY|nr:hypothetical protein OH76DRAFT_1476882 [Polyporus brumalis]